MNSLISAIANNINAVLKFIGVKIVSLKTDNFDMFAAIKRIPGHDTKINCILDIGASNGIWSRNSFSFFPTATFVAVEPLKEREKALQDLKRINPRFDYELCVAGEINGSQTTLNIADDLDGSTVNGTGGETRQVPVKSVDAIVSERGLSGPFLLKFDTHGYEIPILKGAVKTLTETSVIVMEVYNFQLTDESLLFHEMCAKMVKLGFRCYDIASPMLRDFDKAFWQMDLLFCRSNSKIFTFPHYK